MLISLSLKLLELLKKVLALVRPTRNFTFGCHNPEGLKLLTQLLLGLSQLCEHKFKHSFHDSLNPYCHCRNGNIETSCHFFLHCSNFSDKRLALLSSLGNNATIITTKRC